MPAVKKKKKPALPKYVVLKADGSWHVRLAFPTRQRTAKGNIIYEQMTRKVDVQTPERVGEIVREMRRQHQQIVSDALPNNRTFGEFLEVYFASKARSVTARTMKDYYQILNRYIKGTKLAATPLASIKPIDVQAFYDRHQQLGMSPAMVRKVHNVLRMAFRRAIVWEEITKSPVDNVMLPRVPRIQSPAFDRKQARKFIEVCRTNDRFIILEFALETGMRPQEYLALRWDRVDLSRRTIRIDQAITETGQGFAIGDTKTPGSERTITFSRQLKERLIRQKEIVDARIERLRSVLTKSLTSQKKVKGYNYRKRGRRRMNAKALLAAYEKYALVFPAENGLPIARNNLNRREMVEAMKLAKLNIPEFSIRNLRHSSATLLIASGANIKYVSRRLGHSTVNMTLAKYQNVIPEMDREAHEIIEGLLY